MHGAYGCSWNLSGLFSTTVVSSSDLWSTCRLFNILMWTSVASLSLLLHSWGLHFACLNCARRDHLIVNQIRNTNHPKLLMSMVQKSLNTWTVSDSKYNKWIMAPHNNGLTRTQKRFLMAYLTILISLLVIYHVISPLQFPITSTDCTLVILSVLKMTFCCQK